MTAKQFYDWQTAGGTDDVMCAIDCLERGDISRCAIGGIAVNYWADEPMVTQDVALVIATPSLDEAVHRLQAAGFKTEKFEWSINFKGASRVSIQISTADFYKEFPSHSVPADVHGILMRVSSLEDTLYGKLQAWKDPQRRQSKRLKDLADIARLVESHPSLWELLPQELKTVIFQPK